MVMLACELCGREYEYVRNSGHTMRRCNSCKTNERRFIIKRQVVDYLGGKCHRCGYNKCLGALTAHHVDPSKKSFAISGAHSRGWESVKKELDKCVLLCANCHNEEHHTCDRYECKGQ